MIGITSGPSPIVLHNACWVERQYHLAGHPADFDVTLRGDQAITVFKALGGWVPIGYRLQPLALILVVGPSTPTLLATEHAQVMAWNRESGEIRIRMHGPLDMATGPSITALAGL